MKARQRESLFEREHYLGCLTGERRESKMIHAHMRLLFYLKMLYDAVALLLLFVFRRRQ